MVHINAGVAGARRWRSSWQAARLAKEPAPALRAVELLGAGLLWFGWFGFNAGSALGANELAAYAFVNTNTATAAALLAWIGVERCATARPPRSARVRRG